MKKISIALILIATSAFFACKPKSKPDNDIKSIKFQFTELGRETQFRIACDKFDYYFPEARVKNFTQKAGIDSVMQLLGNLQKADDGFLPDVRGKIYLTHTNNTTDTLCVGVKVLNYKDATYQTPQELLALIQK